MPTKKYLFTSTRLGFRNWTKTDYPKMIAISSNTEVMKFFPAPATEGAQACLDYGYNRLNLQEIYSTAPKAKTKSWHIM